MENAENMIAMDGDILEAKERFSARSREWSG